MDTIAQLARDFNRFKWAYYDVGVLSVARKYFVWNLWTNGGIKSIIACSAVVSGMFNRV